MKEEILFLNLLRFCAALSVIGVHHFETLLILGYLPSFLHVVSPLAQYGYLGVDLFFIISGFVITLSSEGRTVGQFIKARFLRLYPLFWICITITSCIFVATSTYNVSLAQYLAGLTMVPDLFGKYAYIDGSYWTLVVELKFYLFIAILLALRSFMDIHIQKVAVVMSFLLAIHMVFHVAHSTSIVAILFGIIFSIYWTGYAQYFLAGILFYGVYKNKKEKYHYFALLLCYLSAVIQAYNRAYATNNKAIVILFITTFFFLFLMLSLKKISNTSFAFLGEKQRSIIVTLGAITYPLYLLQGSVIPAFVDMFRYFLVPSSVAGALLVIFMFLLVLIVNKIDFYSRLLWRRGKEIV